MGTAARPVAWVGLLLAGALMVFGGRAAAAAPDNALALNGSSQYVRFGSLPNSLPDALNASQFTLELWFNRSGTGATTSTGNGGVTAAPLIARGRAEAENSNVDMNYFMGIDANGKLVADFEEGAGQPSPGLNHPITGATTVTNGVWHHAAATYDGQTWRLYLDGKQDGKLTLSQPIAPRSDSIQRTALGSALTSNGTAAGFFAGTVDEARIWNLARTGDQIRSNKDQEITGPTTGLIGRWGLDEGSGSTAADSSASGMTGTLINTPTWVAGYTFPQDTTAPAPVQNLSGTPGDTTVALSWDANGESDLAGYNVYRSLTTPVPTTGTPLNGDDLVQTSGFNDTGLNAGTTYHYAVVAVDGSNNASTSAETAVTTTGGAVANGLQFNGSSQYVTFGQAPGLTASQFTLETWFNRSGTGVGTSTGTGGLASAVPLIAKGRAEQETPANLNMNYFLGIDTTTNALAADFEDTANGGNHPVIGQTVITNGVWHHAVATYDGSTWRLYLDGKLDKKQTVGAFTPESTSIQHASLASALNSTGVASGFFQGTLDEARVWNLARTGDQIRSNKDVEIASDPNLIGRWGMNQTSGNLTDSSGSNTGTLVGGPSYVAGYTFPQDTTAPGAPQGLAASAGNNQVGLSWSANSESDLAGYNLFRATSPGVPTTGTPLNGDDLISASSTSFSDTTAANGTTYYYVLVAVDGSNNASSASNEANATPSSGSGDLVIVGAGDIANCNKTEDSDTAALVEAIPDAPVFTIGDNTYENGTAAEFANCYDPTWGVFKDRTRPTVGNHDYGNGSTPGATPYFDYFNGVGNQTGPAGDRSLGYYSYNLGTAPDLWHIVVLNAECEPSTGYWLPGGCAAGSAQDLWLQNDLATAPTNNIIAIWHKPRWSSTTSETYMQQLWQDLYDGGVDLALAGHFHNYERFAPLDAGGNVDTSFGVREIVVGTGGADLTGFNTILPTSEARSSTVYGVIKLTLHASSYDWQFIPIASQSFTDSGSQAVHGAPGGGPGPGAVNDFNGDGKSDLAWRNGSSGEDYLWFMNGTQIGSSAQPPSVVDTAWKVYGTGDYNGDGKADLLWRNTASGEVYVWLMNGATTTSSASLGAVTDQNWKIVGTGDYNGDGNSDVLWRNAATGENYLWLMNGTSLASAASLTSVSDLSWTIAGSGDYDGNGKADILWRNASTGELVVWLMNGATIASSGSVATVADLDWQVAGSGDYNGDGKADILWRNTTSGDDYLWLMNGTSLASASPVAGVSDTNWKVAATGDYDGNGKADIAWRNTTSGDVYTWLMNGATIASSGPTASVSDPNWQTVPANPPAGQPFARTGAAAQPTGMSVNTANTNGPKKKAPAKHAKRWWHPKKGKAPHRRATAKDAMTWAVSKR